MLFTGALLRVVALLLAGAVVLAVGAVTYTYRALLVPLAPGSQTVIVEAGVSFAALAREWQANGIIEDSRTLELYGRLSGAAGRIKAGEYVVNDGMTPLALLQRVVEGRTVQFAITFVEGWSFRQFRTTLANDSRLEQTLAGLSDAEVMTRLGEPTAHPEGRFFPDTYLFGRGHTDVSVLRRALKAMQGRLASAWEERAPNLPYANAYDALTMASIVEKETGAAHERATIAGVFVRRLRKNMRLQTDPTVIYGMGERFDGNIRKRDLREDTPYNTYVHKGLPPTPIANPGAAAIDAALHPQPGTALYFVSKGDGTHVFSDTYEQHRRAVAEYQLKRRKRGS